MPILFHNTMQIKSTLSESRDYRMEGVDQFFGKNPMGMSFRTPADAFNSIISHKGVRNLAAGCWRIEGLKNQDSWRFLLTG
jgi:hypothetical protein